MLALRPDWPGIRASAGPAVPLLLRTLTLRVVLTIATVVATRIGTVAVAAHQVVFGIWIVPRLRAGCHRHRGPGDCRTLSGRRRHRRDPGSHQADDRVGHCRPESSPGSRRSPPGRDYIPLFTTDSAVRSALGPVLLIAALFQPVAGVVFVLDGVLIGAGDARYLAVAGLARWWSSCRCAGRARLRPRPDRAVVGDRGLHARPDGLPQRPGVRNPLACHRRHEMTVPVQRHLLHGHRHRRTQAATTSRARLPRPRGAASRLLGAHRPS